MVLILVIPSFSDLLECALAFGTEGRSNVKENMKEKEKFLVSVGV